MKTQIQILHFRDVHDTLECLEALFAISGDIHRILVIDNTGDAMPGEPALEALASAGRISLIKTRENMGFAGGHNLGFEMAFEQGAEYVWILNNDTTVRADTLEKLTQALADDTSLAAVSPVILEHATGKPQHLGSVIDLQTLRVTQVSSFEQLAAWQQAGQTFTLWGTALLLRVSALKQIGGFDPALFAYFEDADLSCRLLNRGYRTAVVSDAVITHKEVHDPASGLRLPHYYFYMVRNKTLFMRKQACQQSRLWIARENLAYTLDFLLTCLTHRDEACVNAVLDGYYCGITGQGGVWNPALHMPRGAAVLLRRFAWPLSRVVRPRVS
ncbi:MAG: glycosyltransferase family 2 protein [Thiobacillus sp.]